MLRLWLLPVLFVAWLAAAVDDAALLQRAQSASNSGDKTEVFRAYNDYKSLYLRSMTSHDEQMRYRALEGIVTTGKILRIDVVRYEKELRSSAPLKTAPSSSVPNNSPKPDTAKTASDDSAVVLSKLETIRWRDGRLLLGFDHKLQAHEVNYFKLFDKEEKRYRYIFDVDSKMEQASEDLHHSGVKRISLARFKPTKLRLVVENDTPLNLRFKREGKLLVINLGIPSTTPQTKEEPVSVTTRHHLEKVFWKEGRLVLQFDHDLPNESIDYSKLEESSNKRYRYLFDFDDAMLDKQHDLRHEKLKRVSLAQFDTKTLRLVVENDAKLNVDYKVSGNEVVIDLGTGIIGAPISTQPEARPQGFDKVIVLDPGHGGKDAGAVGHKRYREKVVVLQIANELAKILKQQGYKVYMTRTGDRFIKLQNRTKFANNKQADLFISIHANAVPKQNAKKADGIETYFLSNDHKAGSERAKRVAKMENSKDLQDVNYYGQQDFINILNREKIKKSERLAYDLQRNMLAIMQKNYKRVTDGGVREGPFWILVGAQMPAVLVEVGFITHPTEAARLVSRTYQKRLAEGIANGINQYFIKNP